MGKIQLIFSLNWLIILSVFLCIIIGGYTLLIEPVWVEMNREEVVLSNLPAQFDGFSIVHLSDLHYNPFMRIIQPKYIERCIQKVLLLKPDIVVITGDFVLANAKYSKKLISSKLKLISHKIPTYAVLGNHDYWNNAMIVKEALVEAKIRVFKNGNVALKRNGARIWLMGIDDLDCGNPDIHKALEGTESDEVKILLVHQPDVIEDVKGKVDLILCGHTHGGQITLPLIGPPLVPSKFGAKYATGLFKIGNMQMYVNKGVGFIPPGRFLTRPEIAHIILKCD